MLPRRPKGKSVGKIISKHKLKDVDLEYQLKNYDHLRDCCVANDVEEK